LGHQLTVVSVKQQLDGRKAVNPIEDILDVATTILAFGWMAYTRLTHTMQNGVLIYLVLASVANGRHVLELFTEFLAEVYWGNCGARHLVRLVELSPKSGQLLGI
jgi:hypothetical protein